MGSDSYNIFLKFVFTIGYNAMNFLYLKNNKKR